MKRKGLVGLCFWDRADRGAVCHDILERIAPERVGCRAIPSARRGRIPVSRRKLIGQLFPKAFILPLSKRRREVRLLTRIFKRTFKTRKKRSL